MSESQGKNYSLLHLMQGRSANGYQVAHPYQDKVFFRSTQFHDSFVKRFSLEAILEGHSGCVNTISWNKFGTLLVSGSDDQQIILWNHEKKRKICRVDSGHSANIFCTKFLPATNDEMIASGAGDGEVRIHYVNRSENTTSTSFSSTQSQVFGCHAPRRVKKLAVEDGNPHLVWSAGEDGTLRQYDLRESRAGCTTMDCNCRNILLDLRGASKKSLSEPPRSCLALKSCALNPVSPHYLLVGGSDAFSRMYDRRMLTSLSGGGSQSGRSAPPACVAQYAPMHLAAMNRPFLHLTHVTFSPDGREILQSYSGEHVYLMEVEKSPSYAGHQSHQSCTSAVYRADDIRTANSLQPCPTASSSSPSATSSSMEHDPLCPATPAQLATFHSLLLAANSALSEETPNGCVTAVEACSTVLAAGRVWAGNEWKKFPELVEVRYRALCARAGALRERCWKNDSAMALRDCNEARRFLPFSPLAYFEMAQTLFQIGDEENALAFCKKAKEVVHDQDDLRFPVLQMTDVISAKLTAKAQRTRMESVKNGSDSSGRSRTRERGIQIVSISDLLSSRYLLEFDDGEENDDEDGSEEEDELLEEESERFPGLRDEKGGDDGGDEEEDVEKASGGRSSGTGRYQSHSGSGRRKERKKDAEVAVDMRQRFIGHSNMGTDIKQANFLGERGEFVASGSDDGRWFIWEKKTGNLVKVMAGDEHVVNCIQPHPFDCIVATSGIDDTVKLWSPMLENPSKVARGVLGPESNDVVSVMAENQQRMKQSRQSGLPMELLTRLRAHGEQIQCNQS